MKIGLISVVDPSTPVRKFVQQMCPPLGLLYLQSYLHKHQPGVEVTCSYSVEEILALQPDIIGLSTVSENFGLATSLASRLKERTQAPLLLGGPHISLLPALLPEVFDVGVIGEGEATLLQLVELFQQNGKFEPDVLVAVDGIVFHHPRRGLVQTPTRAPIDPIDSIPPPRRSLVDNTEMEMTHVITSRGCPYKCAFCSSPRLWSDCRMHSAGYVVAEIAGIKEQVDPPAIRFFDDLFIANKARINDIAVGLQQAGIHFPYSYGAFARANLVHQESVDLCRKMNLNYLYLGIESGSQNMLDRLGKKSTVEINQRAMDLCHNAGIAVCCSFVIGVPGETPHDLDATLRFIDANAEAINEMEICPVVPFPGTPLWSDALERGLVSLDMDWALLRDYSDFSEFVLEDYLYLNTSMSRQTFTTYTRLFAEVYQRFSSERVETLRRGGEQL